MCLTILKVLNKKLTISHVMYVFDYSSRATETQETKTEGIRRGRKGMLI